MFRAWCTCRLGWRAGLQDLWRAFLCALETHVGRRDSELFGAIRTLVRACVCRVGYTYSRSSVGSFRWCRCVGSSESRFSVL